MSALADDGAARLDQVMREHHIGASGTLARKPSTERKRVSREVDAEPATSPSQAQLEAIDEQKGTEQVVACYPHGLALLDAHVTACQVVKVHCRQVFETWTPLAWSLL